MPTLLGASPSPFVRKVRLVLAEKGISYEHKAVRPGSTTPEFRKVSPLGKIPAYLDGDVALCDSSVICAYLERIQPSPALYPAAAADYARALWIEEFADTIVAEALTFGVFGLKLIAPLRTGSPPDLATIEKNLAEKVPPALDYLEAQLGGRDYYVGSSWSIADISVATHFVNFRHAGQDVDATRWPQLRAWVDRQLARPLFQQLAAEDRAVLGLNR